jgi:murein DD-endopeptidase MepM/ murein hydrolase activator NlpD
MVRTVVISSLCCIALSGQSYAQEVMIARDGAHHATSQPKKVEPFKKAELAKHEPSATGNFPKAQPVNYPKAQPVKDQVAKQQSPMVQIVREKPAAQPVKNSAAVPEPAVAQSAKAKTPEKETTASTQPPVPPVRKPEPSVLVDAKPASGGTSRLLWPKKDLAHAQSVKPPPPAKESISAPPVTEPEPPASGPPTNVASHPVKSSPAKAAKGQPVVELPKPSLAPAANTIAQASKATPAKSVSVEPAKTVNVETVKPSSAKTANAKPPTELPAVAPAKKSQPLVSWTPKNEVRTEPSNTAQTLAQPPNKLQSITTRNSSKSSTESEPTVQPVTFRGDTAFTRLADGFDFPIGKPDAQGYYKARGFRSHGHLGEDWDGVRGGDTDLGDPIYSIGDGVVVFARDCHMGWGNVLIVRHSYRENGTLKNIDALYGHLNTMLVHRGQAVARGQKIATMGNAHGLYDAHLHLEIRKNLEIGMSRAAFARDFSNYYDPTQFINSHRHLQASSQSYRIAMNTFTRDANINFDKKRNYSHARSGGGTSESAAALKKAVAAQDSH